MFDWIAKIILEAWLKHLWIVWVQGPLNLISIFDTVLKYLTGGIINDLLFGSAKEFSWNSIPVQFWWFVAVAICIFSIIFTIQMIILLFQEASETKVKFVLAIQNSVKAFAFIFLIPIFFFIANFIIQNFANTIISKFGGNSNLAKYLWHIGDPNWDGSGNGVPSDYGPPDNIGDYNFIAQLFGTWFMLFAIFMIGIIIIQKIIELFFLFIISPIVMIIMIIDQGRAAFVWKDMVIAKFLASTGTLVGYYIFISVTQIIIASDLSGLATEGFFKSLFIILFLSGGGLATMAFCDMIAYFVGESVGIREGLESMRSTMGMAGMLVSAPLKGYSAYQAIKEKMDEIRTGRTNKKGANHEDSNNEGLNSDSLQMEKNELNLNPFQNISNAMSSRTGITGLADKALTSFGDEVGKITAPPIYPFLDKKYNQKETGMSFNKSDGNSDNLPKDKNKNSFESSFKGISESNDLPNEKFKSSSKLSLKGNFNKQKNNKWDSKRSFGLASKGSSNITKVPKKNKKSNEIKKIFNRNVLDRKEKAKIKNLSPQDQYLYKINKKINRYDKKRKIWIKKDKNDFWNK